jgi:hypothetical protein
MARTDDSWGDRLAKPTRVDDFHYLAHEPSFVLGAPGSGRGSPHQGFWASSLPPGSGTVDAQVRGWLECVLVRQRDDRWVLRPPGWWALIGSDESLLPSCEFHRRLVDEFVDDSLFQRFLFGSGRLLVLADFDAGGLPG